LTGSEPAAGQVADNRVLLTQKQKQPILGKIVKAVIAAVGLIFVLGVTIYAIAISTIAALPNIDGATVLTIRGAYPINAIPQGTLMTIAGDTVDRSFLGKASDIAGIPSASVVVVIAGPYGTLAIGDAGEILIDGVSTTETGFIQEQNLDETYLTKCIIGPCGEPGALSLVSMDRVVGAAEGTFGITGISAIPIPPTTYENPRPVSNPIPVDDTEIPVSP
jgi:hypothetical protein